MEYKTKWLGWIVSTSKKKKKNDMQVIRGTKTAKQHSPGAKTQPW